MSGRFVLGSASRLNTFSLVATSLALALSAAPALAQSAADTAEPPSAPAQPPAPPEPAPKASEAAPTSPAPPVSESATAPAASSEAAPTAPPAEGTPPNADPSASAAFAPLAAAAPEVAKPQSAASLPAGTATAVAMTPPPTTHSESAKGDDDSGGLLGPFRIGVLVGSGLPEVVSFGAQLKLTRFFGAGVNVGFIPTVRLKYYGEAAQKYQEYDAYGHIYPFGGSFFLGAGVGYAQIDGTLFNRFRVGDVSVDVTSDATVRTLVLTPQIGFLKIFDVGFAIGFDIGAQIPIAPSQVEFNTVAAGVPPQLADIIQKDYINPNDEKVRHTLDTLGRTPLPTFNLKIGWFL